MSDQDVQGLLVQIEATTAQLRRELSAADQLVARTSRDIDRELSGVDAAFDRSAARAVAAGNMIKGAFAALAGAGLVGAIIQQVDGYGQMVERLQAATDSSDEYEQVQARLLRTAQETYRPLHEAQELYIRTADVMRGLGYDTAQTLDITDSFSYLLVTNAASADKAGTALDAYSDSLQKGAVEADSWGSMLKAMPTLAQAVATATGQTSEEVRRLGASGKLSLDDLNRGLLATVEQNRQAAAKMSVTVGDALTNIGTAVQDYLGKANEGAGATSALASALDVVAQNIDVVASVLGGAAVSALTLYVAKAGVALKATLADRAARIAQADAVLQAAIADQRKAETATILAAREAAAARGTAVQTQMALQLAQARQREAAATAAVVAAQSGLRAATGGVLSLLGGPMGLALLAGSAAASFLLMRDGADEARVSLDNLGLSVEEYGRKWAAASAESRRGMLVDAREQLSQVESDLGASLAKIEKAFYQRGPVDGLPFTDVIAQLGELRRAAQGGLGFDDILQSLLDGEATTSELRAEVEKLGGEVAKHAARQATLNERIAEFSPRVDDATESVRNNTAALRAAKEAGDKYIAQLTQRLHQMQDTTALEAANRFIAENTLLTAEQAEEIRRLARAQDDLREARAAAAEQEREAVRREKEQAAALQQLLDKLLPLQAATRQYDVDMRVLDGALQSGTLSLADYQRATEALWAAMNQGDWKKQADELQWLAALQDRLAARRNAIDLDVAGVGMGDRARQELEELNAIQQEYARRREELARQQNTGNALPPELFEARIQALRDAEAAELAIVQEGAQRKLAAQQDWTNGATRALQNYVDKAADTAGQVDALFTSAFGHMEDAIVDFAMTGKASFAEMTQAILKDIARIMIRQAMAGMVGSMFGISPGGGTVASAKGNLFSGGALVPFAKGGAFTNSLVSTPTYFPMPGGKTGLMGEAGPEAIMPLTRGPDGSLGVRALGGGDAQGGTVISVEVNIAADGTVDTTSTAPAGQQFGKELGVYVEGLYRRLLAKDLSPGGQIWRSQKGR